MSRSHFVLASNSIPNVVRGQPGDIVCFFALTFLPFSQEIWALTGNLGRENEVFLQEIWALTGKKWGVFTARRRRKKIGVFSPSTGNLKAPEH